MQVVTLPDPGEQAFAEVGRRCVDVLVERIGHPTRWSAGTAVVVPVHLVRRASTAAPPR
ncbi:MAG: LacI family transcriptional regulator [Klenkia sp.]|nr:LacI family transcriptional regulator [Klenkia sp.]